MSTRIVLLFALAITTMFEAGQAAGQWGVCASCGVPEASCACPDCGCADPCCDVSCGCPEPACGCVDECCDPCCGVPGCGTRVVGGGRVLGTFPLLQRLRNFFCGPICGCGCCGGGCSCETYYGDWHCDPARCEPCDQCGNYTGAQYGMPVSRRPYVANRVKSDQIRFADRVQNALR